jgi:hypothetical protein
VITQLKKGPELPVTGKSSDEKWLQLLVNGQLGRVEAQYVSLSGDLSRVRLWAAARGLLSHRGHRRACADELFAARC